MLFFAYSFADLTSLDKNGGSGVFTSSVTLSSQPIIFSAGGYSGISGFQIENDTLTETGSALSAINVKDLALGSDENYLYAACDSSGLYVLNISDPENITTVTNFTSSGQIVDLDIDGNTLVTGNDIGNVDMYDITSAETPVKLHTLLLNSGVKKVAVDGTLLAVGYENGTLELYDIKTVTAPVIKHTFTTFDTLNQIEFQDDNLVILDGKTGLYIYNVTYYDVPIIKGMFPVENGKGFSLKDTTFYLTTSDSLIYEINAQDITKLQYLGVHTLDSYANSLTFYEDYLIASKLDRSLELFKVNVSSCSAGTIYGQNPLTGNWGKFYSSCDVPSGWATSTSTPSSLAEIEQEAYTKTDIDALSSGWHLLGTGKEITDLSIFDNAVSVWKYKDGKWYVYSSNPLLTDRIRVSDNYSSLEKIEAGMGFWVEVE